MSNLNQINAEIQKLNSTWFAQSLKLFNEHKFYNHESKKLLGEFRYYDEFYDHETHELEVIDKKISVDLTLEQFCWDNSVLDMVDPFDPDDPDNIIVGKRVSRNIIGIIKSFVDNLHSIDPVQINKFILATLERVKTEINLIVHSNNSLHSQVLGIFLINHRQALSDEFRHYKQVANEIETYKDHIKFNLNLEQLAALVLLMERAEFIHQAGIGGNSYLNQCASLFYFYNQRVGTHTVATGIRSKFNDAKNTSNHSGMRYIVDKLQKVIKEI